MWQFCLIVALALIILIILIIVLIVQIKNEKEEYNFLQKKFKIINQNGTREVEEKDWDEMLNHIQFEVWLAEDKTKLNCFFYYFDKYNKTPSCDRVLLGIYSTKEKALEVYNRFFLTRDWEGFQMPLDSEVK